MCQLSAFRVSFSVFACLFQFNEIPSILLPSYIRCDGFGSSWGVCLLFACRELLPRNTKKRYNVISPDALHDRRDDFHRGVLRYFTTNQMEETNYRRFVPIANPRGRFRIPSNCPGKKCDHTEITVRIAVKRVENGRIRGNKWREGLLFGIFQQPCSSGRSKCGSHRSPSPEHQQSKLIPKGSNLRLRMRIALILNLVQTESWQLEGMWTGPSRAEGEEPPVYAKAYPRIKWICGREIGLTSPNMAEIFLRRDRCFGKLELIQIS